MKSGKQSQNSIALLSHLRWISALTVVLSHVRQGLIGKANYIPSITTDPNVLERKNIFRPEGYGHVAVVVFFVLSGFLVGGKLIELLKSGNLKSDWQRFLVDRFARIFVVLWPAVIVSAIVCFALIHFIPDAPFVASGGWTYALSAPLTADQSPAKWAAVVALLNELLTPTITANGPLWSLAYEWSYYIIALGAVLVYRRYFTAGSIPLIAYGLILFVLAAHNQPDILFAGLSWLAGAVAREVYNRDLMHGWIFRIIGVAIVLAVLVTDHKHPLPDPVLGVALAVMLAHCSWKNWHFGARIGERLAAFSYSLYLVHFPMLLGVMGLLYAEGKLPHPMKFSAHSLIIAGAVTVFLVLFARAFAWATEDRTVVIRQAILNFIGHTRSRPLMPVVKPPDVIAKE